MSEVAGKTDVAEEPAWEAGVGEDGAEAGVKVRTHPGLCAAWGNCHRWAPHLYPLDDDGYIDVHLLDVPPEHAEEAWVGATVCPERAITVIGAPERYWRDRRREANAPLPASPLVEGDRSEKASRQGASRQVTSSGPVAPDGPNDTTVGG